MPSACRVQKRECLTSSNHRPGELQAFTFRLITIYGVTHREIITAFGWKTLFFFGYRTGTELGSRGWQPEGTRKEAFLH